MKIILLAGVAVCSAVAQSQTEPPPLLRLHRQLGTISARPYADTGIPVNVVGMTAMTGPPETWLIEMHDSFAGIENADKSLRPVAPFGAIVQADGPSADILAGSRSLIAVFRQAFSYRSEQAIQTLRKARYCQVSIYQVHPGSESDFAELVKSRWIAFDISYHVPSGAASGTYVFLAPLASLKMLDDTPAKAYAENIAAEAMKTGGLTREHLLFRVEPSLSWVSDDFASADPEFWHGKAKTQ
jgi:hypothetical protein